MSLCSACAQEQAAPGTDGRCDVCIRHGLRATSFEHLPKLVPNGRRTSWTAAELLDTDFPEPRVVVDGLFLEGLTLLTGAPKIGKSWLALSLGIAVASGGRALGSIPVDQGEALYLSLEDGPRRLKSRLQTLLFFKEGSTGGYRDAPKGLHLETEWPRIGEGGEEKLGEWLDDHPDARLVMVDVWPRIRPRVSRRTDYYTADYEAAVPLQALASSRGVAIVVVFHTRKAEAEDFVETVSGTFGTAAAADTIVVVKRGRGQADATLHVTGRDVEEQALALRFSPLAGTWTLLGDAAEYALPETRKELLDAIKAHGSLTPKQAAEVTSVGYELAKKTLQRMANDGLLRGNRGRYSLRDVVPPVPESLELEQGDRGTPGTDPLREGVSDAS